EAGEDPDVARARGGVGAEHAGAGVAGGEGTQPGDQFLAGVADDGAAGAGVVAGGQGAGDRTEIDGVVLLLEPVRDPSGRRPTAGGQRAGDDEDRGGAAGSDGAGGRQLVRVAPDRLGHAARDVLVLRRGGGGVRIGDVSVGIVGGVRVRRVSV